MNLLKINRILQRVAVITIIALGSLRILHLIEQVTFLWSSFAVTVISWIISQRVVERLQSRINAIEEKQ